jgi:hypothetical protein
MRRRLAAMPRVAALIAAFALLRGWRDGGLGRALEDVRRSYPPPPASTNVSFLDVDAAPARAAVDGELCGFADRGTARLAPPTRPVPRYALTAASAEARMRRLAAHLLAPWRGGITSPPPSFAASRDGAKGPGTIEVVVAGGAAHVRDGYAGRRRPYEQARAAFVVGLANRLAPAIGGPAAFALSTGDCVATREFRPPDVDACGRRPAGAYAPWQTGQEKSDSSSLQHECSARARSRTSIRASRPLREMIARPKVSRNEWKMTEM